MRNKLFKLFILSLTSFVLVFSFNAYADEKLREESEEMGPLSECLKDCQDEYNATMGPLNAMLASATATLNAAIAQAEANREAAYTECDQKYKHNPGQCLQCKADADKAYAKEVGFAWDAWGLAYDDWKDQSSQAKHQFQACNAGCFDENLPPELEEILEL